MGKPSKRAEIEVPDLRGKSIIALDLGRRTGWCVLKQGIERHKDSGIYELYGDNPRKVQVDDADRFVALGRFLTALDDAIGGASVVVFEQVDGGTKGRQTVLYNGYRAIVLEWARRLGKVVLPLPVSRIKLTVAGRGGASKEEVEAAVVQLGYLPFDDNESDAIACLHTAIRLSKSGDLEKAVVDALKMDLGQFKSGPEVVKKPRKKRLTVDDDSSTLGAQSSPQRKPPRAKRSRAARPQRQRRAPGVRDGIAPRP